MGAMRRTFLGMGAFSAISLLFGVLRELVIARDLQASGAADLFFRGLAVVGASRAVSLSLLRARWIPLGPEADARGLVRRELATCGLLIAAAAVGLLAILGPSELRDPTAWVFAVGIVLAVAGSIVRALAERIGFELRAYAIEWALPIGAILGATLVGRGALGPAIGTVIGLLVGVVALLPTILAPPAVPEQPTDGRVPAPVRWLLLDTLTYVNLGLLDSALSSRVFADGGLALLNYGYLFVNAALLVPSAAATVVALRIAGTRRSDAQVRLRRWALLASALVGAIVLAAWAGLALPPVSNAVDGAAGWSITGSIRPIILYSVPFAALRLANTVGRQWWVAHDPRRLAPYDLVGLAGRAAIVAIGASFWGVLASPIGLAFAELVQLGAWIRRSERPPEPR